MWVERIWAWDFFKGNGICLTNSWCFFAALFSKSAAKVQSAFHILPSTFDDMLKCHGNVREKRSNLTWVIRKRGWTLCLIGLNNHPMWLNTTRLLKGYIRNMYILYTHIIYTHTFINKTPLRRYYWSPLRKWFEQPNLKPLETTKFVSKNRGFRWVVEGWVVTTLVRCPSCHAPKRCEIRGVRNEGVLGIAMNEHGSTCRLLITNANITYY